MRTTETGRSYDKIAPWWDSQRNEITAGLPYVRRAISLSVHRRKALDVGCGGGGRVIMALLDGGFEVTGLDVSQAMLKMAEVHHPSSKFILADVCEWEPKEQYDLIVAWDSIFHVPYTDQQQVTQKLCQALTNGGVILFTAGGVDGEITGEMNGETFYYSSLAEREYLRILEGTGCKCILMDRDQYPENHVVFMAVKRE